MKIILDNIIFALQRTGGISVVWKELEQRALLDKELDVQVLDYASVNSQRLMLPLYDPRIINMPTRKFERYRQPDWKDKNDIFHSSYFRIMDSPTIKNITTIHDLTYHYYRSGLAKAIHLQQERYALQHSASIICVSKHTKQDLLAHYKWLKEEQVTVVYNGVSNQFKVMESVNETPYEHKGYLLYVGNRSVAYKNFNYAVEVARAMRMPLVIVGSNLNEKEKKMLRDRLDEGSWWVKVYPTEEELVSIYNQAYCLLYPSSFEGFGLPIIEAQRTGCLVIGQAVSSVPEVMGNGGICVKASDDSQKVIAAMCDVVSAMIQGRVNTQQLIEQGLQNSQQFTWDRTYEQVKQVYKNVCNQ